VRVGRRKGRDVLRRVAVGVRLTGEGEGEGKGEGEFE